MYQIKQTSWKSGYNFSTYGKFAGTSWLEEFQTRKPLSYLGLSSSIYRKRQTTGF